jgi:hypothetical protein
MSDKALLRFVQRGLISLGERTRRRPRRWDAGDVIADMSQVTPTTASAGRWIS